MGDFGGERKELVEEKKMEDQDSGGKSADKVAAGEDEGSTTLNPEKNMAPSKEWMTAPRLSNEYLEGIESFFDFVGAKKHKLGGDDWYYCPCVKCCNLIGRKRTLRDIRTHLICDGIDTTYTTWFHYGEIHPHSRVNVGNGSGNEDAFPRMVDMVNDLFGHVHGENAVEAQVGGCSSADCDEANDEEFSQA
ncbi:hypothetical protein AAC387_Pa02g1219 [Persea americana]